MNKAKMRPIASSLVQGRVVYQVSFTDRTVEMRELRILTKPMGLNGLAKLYRRFPWAGELNKPLLRDLALGINRPGVTTQAWLLVSWSKEWYVRLGDGYTHVSALEGETMELPLDIAVTVDDVLGTSQGVRTVDNMWKHGRFGTQVFFSRQKAMTYFKGLIPQLRRPKPRPKSHRSDFYEWQMSNSQGSNVLFDTVTQMRDTLSETFALPTHLISEAVQG